MTPWPRPFKPAENEPLTPQPHVWLEQTQLLLGTSSPEANQVAAALANLHDELARYFELRDATIEQFEAALPGTAPHVTLQGEALLCAQHTLLEESERLASAVDQTPASQRDALWWAQLRTRCEAFAAQLSAYESRTALPPDEDPPQADEWLRRIEE